MSELALKLIAENKAKHTRGEDARVLDLGDCGLTEVPEEVGELVWLVWLEELNFSSDRWDAGILTVRRSANPGSRNDIFSLPKSFGQLKNLKKLWLRGYDSYYNSERYFSIIDISVLSDLTDLILLDFSNNDYLSDLSPIKNLLKLESLYLTGAVRVSDLSPISNLTRLKELYFDYYTKVSDLSPIANLSNLRKIYFHNSKVTDLTPVVPLMRKGIEISFHSCPITTPPPEIVQQGTSAILRYFDDLEKEGSDQIYEAKLILIGEGGAGKTTLCRKLFDPNAALPQEKDRTNGIDIHPLYFDIPEKQDKQFRLNIWDFAGQGKYQSAHSFFYTHRF